MSAFRIFINIKIAFIDTDLDDETMPYDGGLAEDCCASPCVDRNGIVTGYFVTSTIGM